MRGKTSNKIFGKDDQLFSPLQSRVPPLMLEILPNRSVARSACGPGLVLQHPSPGQARRTPRPGTISDQMAFVNDGALHVLSVDASLAVARS